MNPGKSPIGGHQITRKEALKGLGDPKKWKKESDAVYAEFRAKPKQKKPHQTFFQTVKTKVKHLSAGISVKPTAEPVYAKSSRKKVLAKRKVTKKPNNPRSRQRQRH